MRVLELHRGGKPFLINLDNVLTLAPSSVVGEGGTVFQSVGVGWAVGCDESYEVVRELLHRHVFAQSDIIQPTDPGDYPDSTGAPP